MSKYSRKTVWKNTHLQWVPPSPNIPTIESARCFAATGTIGVLGTVDIGIGTQFPFQIFGAPWLDQVHAANYLNGRGLLGVEFEPFRFHPAKGLFKGKEVKAVRLKISDPHMFAPAKTELYILGYLQKFYSDNFKWISEKNNAFDKAMGTSKVRMHLAGGQSVENISRNWQEELSLFRAKIRPYLIYQ